ncbi:MAG: enoyl-CoA hydratase [Nitriliruptoraceae bacterium]
MTADEAVNVADAPRVEVETGTEQLLAHTEGGVAWLTFNQPEKHNALSETMALNAGDLMARFEADEAVRVVVVRGAGERAFSAGADISEFGRQLEDLERIHAAIRQAWANWHVMSKPVIAAIRGYCIGGGLLAALRTDMRIAADDSVFSIPGARLGRAYALEAAEMLRATVGPGFASEILFTARRLSADEALACGLVNRVVPVGEWEQAVADTATTIAENAPLTIQLAKVALREAAKPPADRDLDRIDAMAAACMASQDYTEGRAAFKEKRRPHFIGR